MIVGAVACFSVLDGIIKSLAVRHPVPLLVWARWGFQVLAMLIWLAPSMGTRMLHTRQLRMQLLRGGLLVASSLCFMTALAHMPLADATALNYTTPTIVIILAIVFLNERLTLPRMAFVVAGLAGMMMIVQPGAEIFRGTSLFALGSAVLLRHLPDHDAHACRRGPAGVAVLSGAGRHAADDLRVAMVRLAHRPDVDGCRAACRHRRDRARSATSCSSWRSSARRLRR